MSNDNEKLLGLAPEALAQPVAEPPLPEGGRHKPADDRAFRAACDLLRVDKDLDTGRMGTICAIAREHARVSALEIALLALQAELEELRLSRPIAHDEEQIR